MRRQQGSHSFHSVREAGREFSISHQTPFPIILSAQLSAICGLICSSEPGSTSLAKADAKTSHYHDYFGSGLNPLTEGTLILFLTWVFILCVCWNKMSIAHVYEYQDTYKYYPDANLKYPYPPFDPFLLFFGHHLSLHICVEDTSSSTEITSSHILKKSSKICPSPIVLIRKYSARKTPVWNPKMKPTVWWYILFYKLVLIH